ncbi:MAG: hypothetical protein Q8P83_01020 [bacterium]|nr:hypothetical protein [bacterium]
MELTIVIAKVFAIYLVVSGVVLLLRQKTMVHVLKDFFEHPATMWLAGLILVFLGGFLVIQHNVWEGTLETWVTVLAWLVLLKGIAYLLVPDQLAKLGDKLRALWAPAGLLVIVLGVWLFIAAR